jgi:thiamine-phosphate pyrophosphorylase
MRNNGQLKIVVFTRPEKDLTEHNDIKRLFEAGMQTLHIRKPKFKKEEMEELILSIPKEYHRQIVLHSHYGLVIKYKLKGIHFKRKMLSMPFLVKLKIFFYKTRQSEVTFSSTFHSLRTLSANNLKLDYAFLSPVFKSVSKVNYGPNFILSNIADAIRGSGVKVYALGGIEEDRLELVRETGFNGIGLLGAIWSNSHPVIKFSKFQELCEKQEVLF